MGSTRALFASIGISVSLVAAAALSLFTVSIVIAFGGWSAGMGESGPATTLVLSPTSTRAGDASTASSRPEPVVLRAPAKPRPRPAPSGPPHVAVSAGSGVHPGIISHAIVASVPRPPIATAPAATPASPPAAAPAQKPATGDGVRRVGDDLSSKVQSTGKALADVTAPLAPPVASAVQKVVDLVAAVLQRTTNGLGGTLDKLVK